MKASNGCGKESITLHAMHIEELKKMISEDKLFPMCYFCKDEQAKILKFDEISCIFKDNGQLCFACNSHYVEALELKNA